MGEEFYRFCDAVGQSIERINRANTALFVPLRQKDPAPRGLFLGGRLVQRLERLEAGLPPRDGVLDAGGRAAPALLATKRT